MRKLDRVWEDDLLGLLAFPLSLDPELDPVRSALSGFGRSALTLGRAREPPIRRLLRQGRQGWQRAIVGLPLRGGLVGLRDLAAEVEYLLWRREAFREVDAVDVTEVLAKPA